MSLIVAENLVKLYGNGDTTVSAISGISFQIESGEFVGAMGESGIADGQPVWVARAGPVQFLLEDSTAATHGNWVQTSDSVAGRVDATNASAPGAVIAHFQEVGHCVESKGSGTDVLCRVNCHFL